jgi:hypothetical protein
MQAITLTQVNNLDTFLGALHANHVTTLKVVTGWGWPWDAESRAAVGRSMAALLVRTVNGDGTRPPPAGANNLIYLDPNTVQAEVQPWIAARARLIVELGNEPNKHNPSADAAWTFRYWFLETLTRMRSVFPGVRCISPGLIETNQEQWWQINQDAFSQADGIGYHAYGHHDFGPNDTGQIQRAHQQLLHYFPHSAWFATELGINDPNTSASTKCQRYSELHRNMPSAVALSCWYHACEQPGNADARNYAIPNSALPALQAGGRIP